MITSAIFPGGVTTVDVTAVGGKGFLNAWADFNRNGRPDYLLYNSSSHQTTIWYMNNNVRVGTADGPTLTSGWNLVAP